jgi:hypothetical protein
MYIKDRRNAKMMTAHFKSLYQQLPGETQDYRGWPDEVPVWEPLAQIVGYTVRLCCYLWE